MLPWATAEWSFMERISGRDRGFIRSLSLLDTHIYSGTHTHSVSTHVCVLAVTAVTKLWLHSGWPFCFQAIVRSLSIWVRPAVGTNHFGNCWVYRTFFCMATGERNISSSGKKLSGALRQAETRIGQFTPGGGVVSAVGEFTVAKSIKNNVDDSFQDSFQCMKSCWWAVKLLQASRKTRTD